MLKIKNCDADQICVETDEEWLKNRILAFAEESPSRCEVVIGVTMVARIPKGMVWLLKED